MPNQISTGGFEVKGKKWKHEKSVVVRLYWLSCDVQLWKVLL